MQAGTRDTLSCRDRHGHVSGPLVKFDIVHKFRRGYDSQDPIGFLDVNATVRDLKRVKVTPANNLGIVHQTLKLLFFKAIVQNCIVLSCGMIIKCLHLVKFVLHLTMLIEKYLVSPSGVVLVQCMQLIIFVTLRQ